MRSAARTVWLAASMIATVAVVATLAFLDGERESRAALADFADEQARLSEALATTVSTLTNGGAVGVLSIGDALRRLERPGGTVVLLRPPGEVTFRDLGGGTRDVATLAAAFASGASTLRLSRDEAAALGLPARTALAGLALAPSVGGTWGVVVVTSAEKERDREKRARIRLVLGVTLVGAVVLAFGSLARREQRKELLLERRLALADLAAERDERLARASRVVTLGTFASGVAHEVGTPLAVILGRAEQLLPRVAGDERARKSVEAIVEQTGRIDQVLRAFLAVVRGDPIEAGPVSARALVAEAVAYVEHRFEQAEVTLDDQVPDHLPALRGDARLLAQVVVNLLLNACDACAPGGVVRLEGMRRGDEVVLRVLDDGAGISAEAAARATEPFFTTKPAGKGTGLGLAIAHEILKSHRGRLSLAPRSEGGTCAEIALPVGDSHA